MARKANKAGMGSVLSVMAVPALLATAAASYTAFWFYNVDTLKNNLAEFAKSQRQAGYVAKYTYDAASGFPWRITVNLKNTKFGMSEGERSWEIQAPSLTLSSSIVSPRSVMISLPDQTRLLLKSRQGRYDLQKTEGKAEITVETDSTDAIRHLALDAEGVKAKGRWNGRQMTSPLHVSEGKAELVVNGPPANEEEVKPFATLNIALKDWQWPTNANYALGQNLEKFDLSAKLHGAINRKIALQQALTFWREDGGKVSVNRITMDWGESKIGGYGTLVLDENLQPAANLTARVKGFSKIVDVLDQAKLIRPRDATMARLVIGRQLPRSGAGNLSLSLNAGQIYLGPLVLTQVPLIDWPASTSDQGPLSSTGQPLLQPGFDIGRDGQIIRN